MKRQTLLSKRSAIGVAPGTPLNRVGDWFQRYISQIRAAPVRRYILWESWWTTKWPTEIKVLTMIDKVKGEFLDHGIPLDGYLFSAYWETDGWKLNRRAFPRGLAPVLKRLDEIGLRMGLWMGFTAGGGSREWLQSRGYETTPGGGACFAGPKWSAYIKRTFLEHVEQWRLVCWKNDYSGYTCDRSDHGHLPGLYAVSAHADVMIDTVQEARRIRPGFYAYSACSGRMPRPTSGRRR